MKRPADILLAAVAALAGAALVLCSAPVHACPFCSAVKMTFGQEIDESTTAVLARLANPMRADSAIAEESIIAAPDGVDLGSLSDDAVKARFEIVETLKGADVLKETKFIEVLYFGQQPEGTTFLILGVDIDELAWSTPIALSERGVKYVQTVVKLPESGADRLDFFQSYLEDGEQMLAADAYDEFARAPYTDVVALKDRMDREQLLAWIQEPEMPSSRRRLYLTMLGVCGQSEDVAVLEKMIKSEDPQVRTALDALVACYLQLNGPDGLPLVEDLFLKNADAEYTDTYSAIMALRFHGQESDRLSKDRLKESMRHLLDRPELADLVIPDLARWQDWEVMDRLVTLFKEADEESSWVRVPVINYLRAVPKADAEHYAQAQKYIEDLKEVDADAVRRAGDFFPLRPAGANASRDGQTDEPNADAQSADEGAAEGESVAAVAPVAIDPPAPPPSEPAEAKSNQAVASLPASGVGAPSIGTPDDPEGVTDEPTPADLAAAPPGKTRPAETDRPIVLIGAAAVAMAVLAILLLIVWPRRAVAT